MNEEPISEFETGGIPKLKRQFASDFNVRRFRFSAHNLMLLINSAARFNPKVDTPVLRDLFCVLGMGPYFNRGGMHRYYEYVQCSDVFDHGEMWGRSRRTLIVVGHPYHISKESHDSLRAMSLRFPDTLRVNVDDRPSHYGFGSNHVRISLTE